MRDWQTLREQFPVTERYVYMNHAAVAPLPRVCVQGMRAYLDELSLQGGARYPAPIAEPLHEVRRLGAKILGARGARVFIVRSTTQGIGIAATGLPFRPGDNVVLVDREFPANVRPWLPLGRRGVELRRVPQREGRVLIDDLARAIDPRTVAVSVSFVQFLSGFRLDLAAVAQLCRTHDALFVVDGIQGVGVFPVDVERDGVDFLSADAHKWMLGPEGVGLGYASDRALERIEPALEGWLSVERPFDLFAIDQPLKASAARFEEGAYNVAGLHGLAASLSLIDSIGVETMGRRIVALTDQLVDGLQRRGWQVLSPRRDPREKSGIVLCTREGMDVDALGSRLDAERIVASIRGGALRIAPHAYNTPDEIERVVEVASKR